MRLEQKLTPDQMNELGERIFRHFDEYSASDPFGWDWPTMRMIFPNKCKVFARLKQQYKLAKKLAD